MTSKPIRVVFNVPITIGSDKYTSLPRANSPLADVYIEEYQDFVYFPEQGCKVFNSNITNILYEVKPKEAVKPKATKAPAKSVKEIDVDPGSLVAK